MAKCLLNLGDNGFHCEALQIWGQLGDREITVLDMVNLRCSFKIEMDFSRSPLADQWIGQVERVTGM